MKLHIEGLSAAYDGQPILSDVSFDVEEGAFVSILGPSGCGKSTILNILAGVVTPQSGTITVDGQPLRQPGEHFAYMPQEDLLLPWKTIMDNVCLYGTIHKQKAQAREKAQALFPVFGLQGYEQAYPDELSGGMRQRAAFLRTALCHADILLLDEPFGALDVITRSDMQDWLATMRSQLGKTTLLVTHDIDEAIYLSDKILILNGRPASIKQEIVLTEQPRSREWLYAQGALRTDIYKLLREANNHAQ
ncbi:MAG: ABC transporter ATP-binding protein [Peptococcaceae bacterium]|nr:ABC transporter ATP-binding protein [Peptococcaceae bacterium]